ncbi:ABC transporter ATP-binding protein/permease [Eikenella corrodens]|uniref:ABC transporter ATP-binding protein/permease n=1 Tax=Eikenella corrodens TaxID=539 RepID=UPI000B4DC53B|nr:ABC transporter ATP-binding protein/permease [Eikenella corrodens]OWP24156.1 ABC transporter ATP-binding protein [Eikenella corrodens]
MKQEQWKIELLDSPLWLVQSFFGVLLFCLIAAFLLRRTTFGQRFERILRPCLASSNRIRVCLLLAALLLMVLLEVRISVLNSFFYKGLYDSLQDRAAAAFWFFAGINSALMVFKIIHALADELLEQVFMIRWLEKLNAALTQSWLAHKNYYRLHMRRHAPDNIDQRIQQDAQDFIASTAELVHGLISAIVSTIEFTVILWNLSGVLSVLGLEIPRGMVMFIYLFILFATATSVWIGLPLVKLNFQNEHFNGNYRYALVRVRDHAESIAFYNGEAAEGRNLRRHFAHIIRNRWQIVFRSLGLNGFNTGITQISNLLPLMLQAPRFFAGQVKIGDMHQTVQAFNRLQRALSFFRNSYKDFTAYQARLERLDGFFQSMQNHLPYRQPQHEAENCILQADKLTLHRNNGNILLSDVSFRAQSGDSLLIRGPSGCGKTSLLRALAGLWPFGSSGHIISPAREHILFVPQRPYTPQGSLRRAICYPNIRPDEHQLTAALEACRLGYLKELLDTEDDWQHKLSPGELQRIAFVRILITRPRLVLLDEATAALDEETEAALYRLIRQELPDSIIVSIGHRSTLNAFHNQIICVGETLIDCGTSKI